jgi:hypothetical protein
MTEMTSLDPVKLDAAMGKAFSEPGVGVTGPSIVLPSALAQGDPGALGAMAGETLLREVLAAGGMEQVRRIEADSTPFNILLQAWP